MWTAVYWEKISDWFTFVMLVVDIFLCTYNASEATTEKNHWRCFVKKAVYKSFSNFTGKHQSRGLLSIKLQTPRPFFEIKLQILGPVTLLKRDSNAAFFLWNFRNFYEHLFWRTSANDCSFNCSKVLYKIGVLKIFCKVHTLACRFFSGVFLRCRC